MGLPCFEQSWLLNNMMMPWFLCFHFYFSFRTNSKRTNGWEQLLSLFWYFFRKYHPEFTWIYLATITKHFDNSIWKTQYSWRFYGEELIISWVNFLKWKSTKVPGKLLTHNPSLLFEENSTKTFHLLLYASFSLK